MLFYHPAVWWVSQQIRAERELCCDDLAVAASGGVLTYARALAELESQRSARLRPALAANGASLVNRIRRLIEPSQPITDNLPGPGAAWAMSLLWLAGVGVATIHAAQTPAPRVVNIPPIVRPAQPSPAPALGQPVLNAFLYDPFLPQPQTVLTQAAIDGRVVEDHSGAPLASVELRVQRIGTARLVADLETEADGRFRLPELPAGEYRIDLSKTNYIGTTLSFSGAISQTPVVRLVRCGMISGRISDRQGKPVRGAIVYAMPKPSHGGPLRPFATQAQGSYSMVDQNGLYRLFYLPPGQYAVAVSYGASSMALGMTGSAPVSPGVGSGVIVYPKSALPQFFTVAGGEEYRNVDFNLSSGTFYTVTGKVEIPAGSPQSGRFWLALAAADQPSLASASTAADADGSFRFEGIAPGSYYLFASGPSSARSSRGAVLPPEPYFARSRVEVTAQPVEGLAISPQKGQTATFVMRGAQEAKGACPEEAQLTLTALEDWAAVLDRSAPVSSSKEQVLRDLAPARYRVHFANLGDRCYQLADAFGPGAGGRSGAGGDPGRPCWLDSRKADGPGVTHGLRGRVAPLRSGKR